MRVELFFATAGVVDRDGDLFTEGCLRGMAERQPDVCRFDEETKTLYVIVDTDKTPVVICDL